jgi:ubiquinone/menaquinone biosynthesis C-methylase UbiE
MALLTPADLEERRQTFLDRVKRFEARGHDQLGLPDFVLESAGPLEGPVLDLGTGKGVLARALARRGYRVVSVDVSAEEQELAAFLTSDDDVRARIELVEVDGVTLPFADGTFGAAVTVNALHHLDEGVAALGELARVVRPGGKIVVADFSPAGFRMVADLHATEGSEHSEGPVTMDWARGYLRGLGASEDSLKEGRFTRVATFTKRDEGVPASFAGLGSS